MELDLMPPRLLRGLFNTGVVLVSGFVVALPVGALRDGSAMVSVAADDAKLDGAERRHVIERRNDEDKGALLAVHAWEPRHSAAVSSAVFLIS
jgi:hypothetical protein